MSLTKTNYDPRFFLNGQSTEKRDSILTLRRVSSAEKQQLNVICTLL